MKLYHYIPKNADISQGILSVSKRPDELAKYGRRAGGDNPTAITAWLEKTFVGRARAVSVLTEPVKWQGNDPMLKAWTDTKCLLEIDADGLLANGLVDAIWCKEGSDKAGFNEQFHKITPDKIDFSPLPWHLCSAEQGLFFGAVRHYFLVMKDGIIPPDYIRICG